MTRDQYRRTVRAEMHAARCRDKDQTPERYDNDARELARRMAAWDGPAAAQDAPRATITASDDNYYQPEPWELV